jgi:uncharacterized protein
VDRLSIDSALDWTVGIDNVGRIFAVAKHPKSVISLDGADHLLTSRADVDYAAAMISTWAGRFLAEKHASVHAPNGANPRVSCPCAV